MVFHRPHGSLAAAKPAPAAVPAPTPTRAPAAVAAKLRQLLALDLLDERVTADIAQGDQEQREVRCPDEGAEDDASDLQRADVIQNRLALARKDVQHGARDDAGRGAHSGPPEAEERAIPGKKQCWEQGEEKQSRYYCVDELRAFGTQSLGLHLLKARKFGHEGQDEDDGVVEQRHGEWAERHAVGPVAAGWTRAVKEVHVPLWDGRCEKRDGDQAGCQAGSVQDRG
ncbi:hypothetical protein LTR10_015138 [Elasticomyces elasticus]|uniref:Uncharacterized protein n=1 Tax=Exophiala sideris TaxID=1016849 RepID=A0ABR0JR08_9EURO|nr:hypothetical protein LTR10_015138 [Elasticomyces elasticus]KAK5034664.1 hypothetical protein LTR13_006320 [Exophiala sideris]KAK5040014.1 hypothetical protein LTS07_000510 [Exophiala sideris]KAK5068392.1 hypothetical protein LTR69_000511 [Exophiala sideris]KAK5187694.1 hypothetical protein LTR44_000511 [Eurotiomycetes sp. CCFEE 6388]